MPMDIDEKSGSMLVLLYHFLYSYASTITTTLTTHVITVTSQIIALASSPLSY